MKEEKRTIKERVEAVSKDFKGFAFKGSMIDIAIGMMIASSITAVVNSLIKDIINPPIAKLLSGMDFSQSYFVLGGQQYDSLELAQASGSAVITYGNFINALIAFLLTAIILFFLASWIGKLNKKEKNKIEKTSKKCPYCMSEIEKDATRCPFCTSELKKR